MKEKLTVQDVVEIASDLYDNKGFTRSDIRIFLKVLIDTKKADFDLERVYDLIVG